MGTGIEEAEEACVFGYDKKAKKKTYTAKHNIIIVNECCFIMKYFNIWGRISKCGDWIFYNHGDNVWISYNYCSCCGTKVNPIKYKYKKGRVK